MRKRIIVSLLCLFVVPVEASANTYTCNFSDPGRFNVIPPEVRISIAPDGKSAKVVDEDIMRHVGAPIDARFFKNTSSILSVRWRLEDVINGSGQKGTLDYSVVYRKARKKAFMTFRALGYSNTDQGTGTCVLE